MTLRNDKQWFVHICELAKQKKNVKNKTVPPTGAGQPL